MHAFVSGILSLRSFSLQFGPMFSYLVIVCVFFFVFVFGRFSVLHIISECCSRLGICFLGITLNFTHFLHQQCLSTCAPPQLLRFAGLHSCCLSLWMVMFVSGWMPNTITIRVTNHSANYPSNLYAFNGWCIQSSPLYALLLDPFRINSTQALHFTLTIEH